jgi:hypothetical protein
LIVHPFSLAQSVGYVAFVLGVAAFLQKSDRRLKGLNSCQSLVYGVHFALLGNPSAGASALLSGIRSYLSLKTRSPYLAALIIVVNVAFGFVLAKSAAGWLPVVGSCLATLAMFFMRGVRMRLVLLVCTSLWLTNNILSGSIGGTLLESTIATINIITITRLLKERSRIRHPKPLPDPQPQQR